MSFTTSIASRSHQEERKIFVEVMMNCRLPIQTFVRFLESRCCLSFLNGCQANFRSSLLPYVWLPILLATVFGGRLVADDREQLASLFAQATKNGTVTIAPGDYALDGKQPIPLSSGLTVIAYGARFHFPETLGDGARAVLFASENVSDFRWFGGHFTGHVFDPSRAENTWEPNTNTRAILITTTPGGRSENLTFRDIASDDRVRFENANSLPVSQRREGADADRGYDTVCFFGDTLPTNLVRGRQYFVIDSTPEFIRIAEQVDGQVLKFASDGGPQTRLISNLFQAHIALYAPTGSGPGKGAIDLVGCQKIIVCGCRLSALGDAMHIQKPHGIVFSGNHITGSRMGAFFLAEYCKDATITGNTVDGSNGSRVMSVEKSCEDVTIVGNTFRNGGRGSWINQPSNFVLADNVFVSNTTKCERDPRRGRRGFLTGDYERYAELYFTTYELDGRYGNVTVCGNIFTSGSHASHAITFAPGGDTILITDNIFSGPVREIAPMAACENVTIRNNIGLLHQP